MQPTSSHRAGGPKATRDGEWEVFVREETDDPLVHVGSVTAETDDQARREAKRLFDWHARDIWLCPGDAVERCTVTASERQEDA